MEKKELKKTPQDSGETSEKKGKIRWTMMAPMLSAVLVAACVGVSLSSYTPAVYEIQARPVKEETEEPEEENAETEEETEDALAAQEFDLPDGTYEGTGTGYAGKITVSVEIKDKKIVAITILNVEADDATFFNRAKGVIDKIIAAQNLDVDVVSGATYSSRGIISAVKNALTGETDSGETASQQTTGQGETSVTVVEDAAAYRDGEYYGSATGFAGPIQVKVVISGGKIASIEIVSTSDGSSFINSASAILGKMVEGQTTNVDTVSGATYSSVGIINAVRNALSQAATSAATEEIQTVATVSETTGNTNQTGTTAQNGNANGQTQTDPVTPAVTGNFPYPDGTYYGEADGFEDIIKVAVVIKDKTIASVTVVGESDDEPFFTNASALLGTVVESQTTAVDTVSGATYSSKGILGAIDAALAEAKAAGDAAASSDNGTAGTNSGSDNTGANGNENSGNQNNTDNTGTNGNQDNNENQNGGTDSGNSSDSGNTGDNQETEESVIYKNDTYTVTVPCEPIPDEDGVLDFEAYNLTATITIAGDQITGISDVSGDGATNNNSYIKRAVSGTKTKTGMLTKILALSGAQILEDGDSDVADNTYRSSVEALNLDTVSGATCTSKSLIQACLEALTQAKEAMTQANGTEE